MTKIKNLTKIKLPREKLVKYGSTKLKDFELLAILLGSGIKGKNVLSLAKIILKKIKIIGLKKITIEDIKNIKGIGSTKAMQIIALIELSNRFTTTKPEILSPKDIWKLCADIRSSKREHFVAFYLDTQSRLIERQIISIGTLSTSLVHSREVFEPALSLHAASIIVAHNHPSNNLKPSTADLALTKILIKSGKILGIPLENHVILTPKGYFNLKIKS